MWNLRGKWSGPCIILLAWTGRVKVIGRTVFIALTWEPLIPVKYPEKQLILTASHRSLKPGKLRDVKILNHVLLTNKILIWAPGPHRTPFFYWKRGISEVQFGRGSGPRTARNTSHFLRGKIGSVLVPLQPMGTGAAHSEVLRALQEDC